ncbi:MAG: hypothetical protein WCV73_03625 [Patescibacteria group bacterium]|jgi:hypothetical protein
MPHLLLEKIKERNRLAVKEFSAQAELRRKYLLDHPTRLAATKCMDGRVNLSVITNMPFGVFRPWRNIGGMFNIGWLAFSQSLREWVSKFEAEGREGIIFITYHWSNSAKHLGCRGFDYNLSLSKKAIGQMAQSVKGVFVGHRLTVIFTGVETDSDALIIHGDDIKNVLDMRVVKSGAEIKRRLIKMFPKMTDSMHSDLLNLLAGNAQHIKQVALEGRELVELNHCEKILAVGQGFDWIHESNEAIIVGPFNPNLEEPIITAVKLIMTNRQEGRVKSDRGVLLVCMPWSESWHNYREVASERARVLADLALTAIKKHLPQELEFFYPLVGVMQEESREFTEIPYHRPF